MKGGGSGLSMVKKYPANFHEGMARFLSPKGLQYTKKSNNERQKTGGRGEKED